MALLSELTTKHRIIGLPPEFPRIVCLCGSTRFRKAWTRAHREESLAGKIVLGVGVMLHAGDDPIRQDCEAKRRLDELHFRKIELADEVFVLNVEGYVGHSTANELAYARALGKPVRFLEPEKAASS
jgi:nucleoside 2-deoxyribosyltransferase